MAWNGSDGGTGSNLAQSAGGVKTNGLGGFLNKLGFGGWLGIGLGILGGIGLAGWGISAFRGGSNGNSDVDAEKRGGIADFNYKTKQTSNAATNSVDGAESGEEDDKQGVRRQPPPPPKRDWQQLQREAMARKLGRQKEHKVFVNDSNATDGSGRKPIHRNSAEHIMSMVFTTNLGDMPPPLPTLSERDRKRLAQILMDKFEIAPDDPDAEEKQILNEVKDALAEYIREGGDADEFFSTYHRQLELAHRERTEARKLVLETAKEGDAELAKELLDRFNENLEAKGVKPVNLPHWIIEKKASVK